MKKEKNKKVYWIRWRCSNCGDGYPYKDNMPIPRGKIVEEYFKQKE